MTSDPALPHKPGTIDYAAPERNTELQRRLVRSGFLVAAYEAEREGLPAKAEQLRAGARRWWPDP